MDITVVYSAAPRKMFETSLSLPEGACVADALRASGVLAECGENPLPAMLGVWGRKARPEQLLQPGDRVEIYRPLTVDPMEARRSRFKRQGAGTTGLFAHKRAGAKSGY